MFHVGDVVKAFGVKGRVTWTGPSYLTVYFENGVTDNFRPDGRLATWHVEPSLELVKSAPRPVKKTLKAWVNIYPNRIYSSIMMTLDEAEAVAAPDRIACCELTGEYEVME